MFGTRTEPTSQSFFLPRTNTNTKHCAAEAHRFTFLFFASFRNSHTEKRHTTHKLNAIDASSDNMLLLLGSSATARARRRLLILNFYRTQSSNFHGNTAHSTERNALLDDDDVQHQSGAGWSTLTIHTTGPYLILSSGENTAFSRSAQEREIPRDCARGKPDRTPLPARALTLSKHSSLTVCR